MIRYQNCLKVLKNNNVLKFLFTVILECSLNITRIFSKDIKVRSDFSKFGLKPREAS